MKNLKKSHTTKKEVDRMTKRYDPKREQAFKIFKAQNGRISNREIAKVLAVDEKKVAVWKGRDQWNQRLSGEDKGCTTKKASTTKKKPSKRDEQEKRILDALKAAGTYSPSLDILIEIYLDAYMEYAQAKENGEADDKQRKEVARLLGQLGLDGRNKGISHAATKNEEEQTKESTEHVATNNKLLQFRQRRMRG